MSEEVQRREERERLQREQNAADLMAVLETAQGRRFVSRLIFEFGGLQAISFSSDSHQHAYNDGQRRVALEVEREARLVAPRLWALMHQERITLIGARLVAHADDAGNKTDQ